MPLMILPFTILVTIGGLAAVKRIDDFLASPEVSGLAAGGGELGTARSSTPSTAEALKSTSAVSGGATVATVSVRGGVFRWPESLVARPAAAAKPSDEGAGGDEPPPPQPSAPFVLGGGSPIEMDLKPGLTVFVGAVASGKSALLAACLGEMSRVHGLSLIHI